MSIKVNDWLLALQFKKQSNGIWSIDIDGVEIKVNIKNEVIMYPPEIIIGRKTTTNFSSEENFVVLDIIVRLLKQGYNPKNIVIEKGYRLGHVEKSGNADVTVHDNNEKTFMIIEAKTFGNEFHKAWADTLSDGGQLFSYERQENTAEVIVLYTSRVYNGRIENLYHAINLMDNVNYLETLDKPRSYETAVGGVDKFKTWKETYQYDYLTNGVLEEDIQPYIVNKSKKSILDLNEITHDEIQKKYNEFASILRRYNIGGRENAFDKLVNLFLAKIVDEQQNPDDLQFNWKGVAQDTYFDLVDRLQKLYQMGMEKFLNETVTYVAEDDVAKAFRMRKDAAKDAVLEYFKQLKYFSNNDFSFIEVYNENLFYQNSRVLVDLIKMFQNIKLKSSNQNQFLGDLFEGFLDNGVKQTEGQFFTPIPIVKFIISSLPIEDVNNNSEVPKVIDYACGAGHFLNEYADQISEYINEDLKSEYFSSVYGIEKEYRLSKVAKVASFMYGQDDINIVYGDGLKEQEGVKDNSFSVVIANPPYSVRGFLTTLTESERKKYTLMDYVSDIDTNNSIELFFIERTKQLLKSGGVAGLILPVSILSNGTRIFSEARKMILENFDIIAIVEFGDRAFSSTGTNTITMFLRKKQYPPSVRDYYKYSIDRWFDNEGVTSEDVAIIKKYTHHIGIEYNEYIKIQKNDINHLDKYDVFKSYANKFKNSSQYKRISGRKINNRFTKNEKDNLLAKEYVNFVKELEKEKVFYYSLANDQSEKVIIVKSPTKAQPQKDFLGYEWSNRRGQEGIKYLGISISDEEMEVSKNQAIYSIKTPLFNPNNLFDEKKINTIIKSNFNNQEIGVSENLSEIVSTIPLSNMLDFSRDFFDAQIKTIIPSIIETPFPNKKLGDVVDVLIGGTPSRNNNAFYNNGKNLWVSIREMNGNEIFDTNEKITDDAIRKSNVKLIPKGTTLLSFKLTIGKTAIAGKDLYTNEAIAGLIPKSSDVSNEYLYSLFNSGVIELDNISGKAFGKSLNKDILENDVLVPVPPKSVQDSIVKDIKSINEKINNKQQKLNKLGNEKEILWDSVSRMETEEISLTSNLFDICIGSRVLKNEISDDGIPVLSANIFEPIGLIDKVFFDDFSKPSVLWSIDNDWMIRVIESNIPFYPTDHAGVIRVNDANKIDYRYLATALYHSGNEMKFDRSHRASTDRIKGIVIKAPSIKEQMKLMDKFDKYTEEEKILKNEIKILNEEKKTVVKKRFQLI